MAHDKRTRDLATMCIRFVAPYIWVAVSKAELPRPEKIQIWQFISTCLDFAKTNNSDRSLKIQKWQFISTCLDFAETNNSTRSLSVKTLITVISLYWKTTPSWSMRIERISIAKWIQPWISKFTFWYKLSWSLCI